MRALPLLLLLASPCFAQAVVQPAVGNCYEYAAVAATLAMYGETSTGPTLVDGTAVEVFIGSKTKSITVIEVFPSGLACYRAFENGWGAQPKNMVPG